MDVAILHPGEMGSVVGAVARADVWWAPEGRSEATAARGMIARFDAIQQLAADSPGGAADQCSRPTGNR